jgi:hypothetical protein
MTTTVNDTARVQIEEVTPASGTAPAKVRVSVPSYAYRVDLVLDGDAAALAAKVGTKVNGTVRGKALRAWQATAGGCFIEPVWGAPRIVQGRVLAVDVQANAVLLDLAFPAWVTLEASQNAGGFHVSADQPFLTP